MKSIKLTVILTILSSVLLCFTQCSLGSSSKTDNLSDIEKDLKAKFGANAYYTQIAIVNDKTVGSILNVTVTAAPSSMKMEQWSQMRGDWQQTANVTMEFDGGAPEEFMFDLNKDASMAKMTELVAQSKKKLADEKQISNPFLKMLTIISPTNGTKEETKYQITLEPENGGTNFNFIYNLAGQLIDFSY